MKVLLMVAAIAAAVFAGPAALAGNFLIRGAKVYTVSAQGTLENADVLVRDGKIAAVGRGLTTACCDAVTVVDARGRPLTPGLFGGLASIGVAEVPRESDTVDAVIGFGAPAWQQQWRPEFDVTLAYNPRSSLVPVTRIEGLTWVLLAPQSSDSIISGQGAAVTLDGRYDAVLHGSRSLFVTLGSDASPLSGGTRAAQYMLLRQAIRETRAPGAPGQGALLHVAGREALSPYLAGGRVVFEVQRAADIHQLIAFAQRAGMKPVISGGSEAWIMARELAAADVPVILNPLENLPSGFDRLGARLDNAARLHQAGVRIAFSSGDSHNARKIRQLAGNAVAHGLPWEVALAALTSTPAEIFGLAATHGHIAVGQDADLVLWDGDPLEVTTIADQVWIAGRPIEMRSRQTELRDRYLKQLKAK